jgi:divalent metal cation (Fe/Co/Zn/Cd) transporter
MLSRGMIVDLLARRALSVPGIIWTAITAVVMFALAAGKARTGRALGNPVLRTEGRVTLIDGTLASAVLLGLALNATPGWCWAVLPLATCWSSTPPARCGEIFLALR